MINLIYALFLLLYLRRLQILEIKEIVFYKKTKPR